MNNSLYYKANIAYFYLYCSAFIEKKQLFDAENIQYHGCKYAGTTGFLKYTAPEHGQVRENRKRNRRYRANF